MIAGHERIEPTATPAGLSAACSCGWVDDFVAPSRRQAKDRWNSEHAMPVRISKAASRRAADMEADPASLAEPERIPGGLLKQVGPDHWVAICRICPGRRGRRGNFDTEDQARNWFLGEHLSPESIHWKVRYPSPERKARMEAEEAILAAIFANRKA